MEEQILEYYEAAGIDKGVILTTWTPSREPNDRALRVYEKYPDRFIPFGHVRPVNKNWKSELKRIAEPPWKGLNLHEGELHAGGRDLRDTTKMILRKVAEYGIPVVKIHLQEWPVVQEIVEERIIVRFITTHFDYLESMGSIAARKAAVEVIEEAYITDSLKVPYVLTGDLNAIPESVVLKLLEQKGWVREDFDKKMLTVPSISPNKQIDYVLVRPGKKWHIIEIKVLDEVLASDHRPILMTLELIPEK